MAALYWLCLVGLSGIVNTSHCEHLVGKNRELIALVFVGL